jgi:AraC-like DNA-binding protein
MKYAISQGIDAKDLLLGTNLVEDFVFTDQDHLSGEVHRQLILNALKFSDDKAFAFNFGKSLAPTSHGMLGMAALSSATIEQALMMSIRFTKTRTPLFNLEMYKSGQKAHVKIEEMSDLGDMQNFAVESFVGAYISFAQFILKGNLPAATLMLSYSAPDYVEELIKALPEQLSVQFDMPCAELVFDASVLSQTLGFANFESVELAEQGCEQLLLRAQSNNDCIKAKVRSLIEAALPKVLVLNEVAELVHISPRTLRRQLSAKGVGYKEIVDDVRKVTAIMLLERRQGVAEVAYQLGYNDPSNFCRAFKKWTGLAPSVFVAEVKV